MNGVIVQDPEERKQREVLFRERIAPHIQDFFEEYEKEALSNGASCYILKKNMAEELLPAIQQAGLAGSATHKQESAS